MIGEVVADAEAVREDRAENLMADTDHRDRHAAEENQRARHRPALGTAKAGGVDEQEQDQREHTDRDCSDHAARGQRHGVMADEFDLGRARAHSRVGNAGERGFDALQQAHLGRAFERLCDDNPAQQVERPTAKGRHAETAAAIGLVGNLLGDLACGRHRQGSLWAWRRARIRRLVPLG